MFTQFSVEWPTSARFITEIAGSLRVVCIKKSNLALHDI